MIRYKWIMKWKKCCCSQRYWSNLRHHSCNRLEGLRKTTKNLDHNSLYLNRFSNFDSFEWMHVVSVVAWGKFVGKDIKNGTFVSWIVLSKGTYGATRIDACPSVKSKLSAGILRLVTFAGLVSGYCFWDGWVLVNLTTYWGKIVHVQMYRWQSCGLLFISQQAFSLFILVIFISCSTTQNTVVCKKQIFYFPCY